MAKKLEKLFKTTIVIWSEDDPRDLSLGDLAREAERGSSYCSKSETRSVEEPSKDPDWDGTEFFGVD
jgi:hypothetical protein